MQTLNKYTTITTGLAMFSMFFGAGNVVFPLALGQIAQDQNFYAIIGLLITAVGVPFSGLIAMTLYNGDYGTFFQRMGKIPGFIVALIIMGLIGPFGAIPRCITLSHSTLNIVMPGASLYVFSIISCIIIFLFTIRKNFIVNTLGIVLTPLLLISLGIIIIKGLFSEHHTPITDHEPFTLFLQGLKKGYLTMDLLGAFFFSSVIIDSLKSCVKPNENTAKVLVRTALKASYIGAFLLGMTYMGFSYVASFYSGELINVPSDELIARIAIHILGPQAAIIACIAVSLACLTTAIALAAVFSEFVHKDIVCNKFGYGFSLILTLLIAFLVSTLDFKGIAAFLEPILQVCYPALIMLTILNILYKLYQFKPVKIPVLIIFLISLTIHFMK